MKHALTLIALVALTFACAGAEEAGDAEYAARMATEHAGETPTPTPAAEAMPAGEVTSQEVAYATVGGKAVTGYLAKPAGAEGAPGLIMIHEWYGLNDNIRSMADRFAGEGYTALAVDLYGVPAAADGEGARKLMEQAMANEGALEENLRQAYRYLAEEQGAPRVGTIGWCFGGGWSLRTAMLLPEEIDATVIYYGRVTSDREALAPLDMPILGIFGAEDQGIPVDSVRAFEAALAELGKDAEIHVYEGADHAFANPSGQRYNQEAAEDAWGKTTAFLAEHLKGG